MRTVDVGDEVSQTAQRKKILNAYTDSFIEMFDLDPIGVEKRQQLRSETLATGEVVDQNNKLDESSNVFRIEAKTVAMYW
ncbi:hypothetical protein [Halopiger aswanensis]|uniref:hypothetical protein n=1 Tax=Halopiger aswanensis TaxID=148449 RepID=UPI0011C3ED2C|nr:hypothetical protein [Halopiger aswanensis]